MDSRALIACLAVVAFDAGAGGVYKCVDGGGTTYQSTPCARGQAETPIRIASAPPNVAGDVTTSAPVVTPFAAPAAQPRKRGRWPHATTVEIGISDDEVLNMPGWGRPRQISRVRGARGWEEVWRYGNGYSGERELRFVNARLADIVDTPAAMAYAR